jgi:hypothetical protein
MPQYPSLFDAVQGIAGIIYEKGMKGQPITDAEISYWTTEFESYPQDWHPQEVIDAKGDLSD